VAIDGALFQAEVESAKVLAVPTVFLNGEPFDQGRMSLEQIVAKLDTGAAEGARPPRIDEKAPFDVLVVGGGPAGAAAAIYAARKGIRTGVAAERFGGQVLDTMAIENFISVPYTEGPKLAAALEQHVARVRRRRDEPAAGQAARPGRRARRARQVELANGATLRSRRSCCRPAPAGGR
jgi:alkyl hydroperoxide reductase subunit F